MRLRYDPPSPVYRDGPAEYKHEPPGKRASAIIVWQPGIFTGSRAGYKGSAYDGRHFGAPRSLEPRDR